MRSVCGRRFMMFALVVVLGAQGAFAAPLDDSDHGFRRLGDGIRNFIITILDELGTPRP
jgi:hypothetical protein